MDPHRHAGIGFDRQRAALADILRADPVVWPAIELAARLDLPAWLVVSGAIYNTVWNALTGRPPGHGVKDIDLFYFDGTDLSWEAEDRVIRGAAGSFAGLRLPVEIRNQARVHLWYPARFGRPCPQFCSSAESLRYFASRTHAVGVRLKGDGAIEVVAPFGLDDIFSMRIVPNYALDNRQTHEEKAARAKAMWPEVEVVAWDHGHMIGLSAGGGLA
jgi:hypothetical protein